MSRHQRLKMYKEIEEMIEDIGKMVNIIQSQLQFIGEHNIQTTISKFKETVEQLRDYQQKIKESLDKHRSEYISEWPEEVDKRAKRWDRLHSWDPSWDFNNFEVPIFSFDSSGLPNHAERYKEWRNGVELARSKLSVYRDIIPQFVADQSSIENNFLSILEDNLAEYSSMQEELVKLRSEEEEFFQEMNKGNISKRNPGYDLTLSVIASKHKLTKMKLLFDITISTFNLEQEELVALNPASAPLPVEELPIAPEAELYTTAVELPATPPPPPLAPK